MSNMKVFEKAWIVWTHDPCMEGGWHVHGEFDTKEEAVKAAQEHDAEEEARFQKILHGNTRGHTRRRIRSICCYDGCIVTPAPVFKIERMEILKDEDEEEGS